jgi:hypothetical protein
MNRPNITIHAEDMLTAQGAILSADARRKMNEWADAVEDKRLARGEDAEGARPERFNVPVIDRTGALLGHLVYSI